MEGKWKVEISIRFTRRLLYIRIRINYPIKNLGTRIHQLLTLLSWNVLQWLALSSGEFGISIQPPLALPPTATIHKISLDRSFLVPAMSWEWADTTKLSVSVPEPLLSINIEMLVIVSAVVGHLYSIVGKCTVTVKLGHGRSPAFWLIHFKSKREWIWRPPN